MANKMILATRSPSRPLWSRHWLPLKEPTVILMRDDTKTADVARLATEKAVQEPGTAAFLVGVGIRKVDASLRLLEWQTSNDHNDTTGYIDWVRTSGQSRMDQLQMQLEMHEKLLLSIAESLGPESAQYAKKMIEDLHQKLEAMKEEEERQFQEEVAERKARAEAAGYNEDDYE